VIEPASVLAETVSGTTEQTIYKWRTGAIALLDAASTAHRVQTTLTPAQEAVGLRCADIARVRSMIYWRVVREVSESRIVPSRSGLDRCLASEWCGQPCGDLKRKEARQSNSGFKAYEPGYNPH